MPMKQLSLICSTFVAIVASAIAGHAVGSPEIAGADAGPAASSVYFFQGVPDQRLDLCVDGIEMASAATFDSMAHAVTLAPSSTRHRYSLRKAARGACDGALVDEGWFYAFGGDQVIVMAHQWRDGTARSEPLWLPAQPAVRHGETRFVVGNYAAAPRLLMAVDGKRIKHLELDSGGPSYLFRGYAARKHTFTFRMRDTRELVVRRTLWMPQGVEFLIVIYGGHDSGYRLRVFSRTVGVRYPS